MAILQMLQSRVFRSLREGNSGQALVETALAFPIMLAMLLGSVELARVAYAAIRVTSAAEAGVQYGTQNGFTVQDATGIATAASNDAVNLTGMTTTSSLACACSDGTASTCLNTDCSSSHLVQPLTVNTQYAVVPVIKLKGLPTSYTVRGKAIQRCLQ